MNPIQKAIADVKFKIPYDILNAAFVQREFGQRPNVVNIDAIIRDVIIERKVRPDCNLMGGTQVEIYMGDLKPEYLDPYTVIYRIPKEKTQNRSITRVLSISMGSINHTGTPTYGTQGYSNVLSAAESVMASFEPVPLVSTANLSLIAENTVMVQDTITFPVNSYLRCYVENDENFSQLRAMTYIKFSRLVELAVKAYIFNKLALPMGQAQLVGGQELGRFREIVDGYADAAEMYDTFLQETWAKTALMDDTRSRERHLRLLVGRR